MNDTATRSVFVVLVPLGQSPTALTNNLPVNQKLGDMLSLLLAIPGSHGHEGAWGEPQAYRMSDLYGTPLDPALLIRQVPFPGVVIAATTEGRVEVGDTVLTGAEAAAAVAHSHAMSLFAQREDEDDAISRRYLKFLSSGLWRFEPTPITGIDLAVTYHEADQRTGEDLMQRLSLRGVRCRARCVTAAGAATGIEPGDSPARDARALAVVISPDTQHEPWIAHDVGAAWVAGIPVVPVLIGDWTAQPPDILAPYQRVAWRADAGRAVEELVDLLGLLPWSIPVSTETASESDTESPPGSPERGRKKGAEPRSRRRKRR